MNILAFESSCDETAAAVVCRGADGSFTIKSNIIASQAKTHALYGGVVPEIAGRAHIEAIYGVAEAALTEAGCTPSDIDLVAVANHPGLIGALLVGVNFAKAFAVSNGIPLVAVNHVYGHIAATYLAPADNAAESCAKSGADGSAGKGTESGADGSTGKGAESSADGSAGKGTESSAETSKESYVPHPPFIALACSGGHTAIYLVNDYTDIREIGGTRDDAIGESFDKIGRMIGIPYPAGAGFDALAKEGFIKVTGDSVSFYKKFKSSPFCKSRVMALPSPALADGSLDFSFSGLKTAAINLLHRYEQRGEELPRAEFAAAYTYEAVEAVAKKLTEALARYPGCDLVCAGGVAANSHLRARLAEVARRRGVKLCLPPLSLCGDNAAMIAAQGYYEYESGHVSGAELNASALDTGI